MESALIIEYLLVLLMLIVLEGLLSADNALVLAVMVKHLPEDAQKKALFYGLIGAFVLRFSALFLISFLANVWQAQALGALYLIYLALKNLFFSSKENENESNSASAQTVSKKEFWLTIAKVELADIAFAVDSILAAVALAITLPETGLGHIGGMDARAICCRFLRRLYRLIINALCRDDFCKFTQKTPRFRKSRFSNRRLGRDQIRTHSAVARIISYFAGSIFSLRSMETDFLRRDDFNCPLGLF